MIDAIEIRGPFHGPTGYDRHVRGFARALHELGVAVRLVDLPEWGPARLPTPLRDPWYDTLDRDVGAQVVLHCCLPPRVRPDPRRANVNYTMFEATPIPPDWAEARARVERVVVPTASSVRMWQAARVAPERLAIAPLGIDARAFARVTPGELPGELPGGGEIWQRRTRVLSIAEVNGRKNLPALLRAWREATRPDDDAVLILKPGLYQPGARQRLNAMLSEIGAGPETTPASVAPIVVVDRLFSDAAMPAFIAAATHYISVSFGEGWDQPMVEAGAAGLRLIAPAHSAYLAYLDASCATLLPVTPRPTSEAPGLEPHSLFAAPGMTWWQPDEPAIVATIRAAIAGQDEAIASPRERILREMTWERAARRLLAVLSEVEPPRAARSRWRPRRWNRRG